MTKFCLNLKDKEITFENAGNKAYTLSIITIITDVSIPNGFVITTKVFETFVENNNLDKVINETIQRFLDKKISAEEASIQIKTAISKGKIETNIINEIYDKLCELRPPFAVRSSSTAEDSLKFSFAGLFDSFLYIKPKDLKEKIKEVYASLFNVRAIEYAYRNGIDLRNIKMGILVQEMIKGEKFGVGFYFKNSNAEIFAIESVVGEPSEVTAGKSIPDTYIIKNRKITKYPRKINLNSLFDFEINEITFLMKKLKNKVFPLDIEWALEEGKLWLLQLRPLTRNIPIPKGKQLLHGLPASPGKICGKVVIWNKRKKESLERGKDKILIAEEVELEDVEIVKDFGGVVLEVSGVTAHASILAREIKIPCIVGVDGITKIVNPGEKICIDGNIGKITFLERESFSIERKYEPIYINPRKLKYFRWNNHMVLFLKENSYAIVFHAGLKDEIKQLYQELRKKIKKPLIDGGVDVWYGYGMILEMSQLKKDIYRDFLYGLKSVESMDQEKILDIIKKYSEKIMNFYEEAEKKFKLYLNTKDRRNLSQALQNTDFAYAYWKIIGHAMLYDYAENIMNKTEISKKENFLKFINEMEQNKNLNEIGSKVVDLVGKILNIVEKDLNLDYSLYTSEIALLSSINLKEVLRKSDLRKLKKSNPKPRKIN